MNFKAQKTHGILLLAFGGTMALSIGLVQPVLYFCFGLTNQTNLQIGTCYSFMNLVRDIYFIQFLFAASSIKRRFRQLNEALSSMTNMKKIGNFQMIETKVKRTILIVELYQDLCDAVEIVNQSFTFHFIGIFLGFMVKNQTK
jgi:hypothetical protein